MISAQYKCCSLLPTLAGVYTNFTGVEAINKTIGMYTDKRIFSNVISFER